jgi:hypothetical protein
MIEEAVSPTLTENDSRNSDVGNQVGMDKNRLLNFIKKRNNYIKTLPKKEKQAFIASINELKESKNRIERLFLKKKSGKNIDDLLFSFDDLPLFGKEYWFMKFTANDGSKRQFFLMFGRTDGDIEVNGRYIKDSKVSDNRTEGYCVSWEYDEKQRTITDDLCTIEIKDDIIACFNDNISAEFCGSFPEYSLNIMEAGKKFCSLTIKKPENTEFISELSEQFKGLFGFRLANLYFDFEGQLSCNDFSGKCYAQKVIVVGPFIPWKWSRIVFRNGSILTYFVPSIEVMGVEYDIYNSMSFYDSMTQKMHYFEKVSVHEYPSEKEDKRWIVTAEGNKVFVVMKSYCKKSFSFRKDFDFKYIENLVEVIDLKIETNYDVITLDTTGSGQGMVEDTSGFVI